MDYLHFAKSRLGFIRFFSSQAATPFNERRRKISQKNKNGHLTYRFVPVEVSTCSLGWLCLTICDENILGGFLTEKRTGRNFLADWFPGCETAGCR